MESHGMPAQELSDEELERLGTYTHATRTWVLLHGTAEQFRHHTERMLELEQEYIRRHPKRTWQGVGDDALGSAGLDEASQLRLALNGVVRQLEALLSSPVPETGAGVAAPTGGDRRADLLRRFAAAPGGRLHKLEAHQAAREVGLTAAELAGLYKTDPPLLMAEGEMRLVTEAGIGLVQQA